MEYTKKIDGESCSLALKGKFTFSDHSDFKSVFELFKGEIKEVDIDIGEVEFVDSAALGLLLLTRDESEKAGIRLSISSPKGQVKKMFEISKFYDLFDIKD